MMWLDSLTPEGELSTQRQRLQTTSEVPEPGFWQGAGDAIGPGLLRGGLEAGAVIESGFSSLWQGGLDLAASALLPEPRFGGEVDVTSAERGQQEDLGQGVAEAVKELRPDARTTGLAGQLLGEAAAILPRTAMAAATGGVVAGAVAAGAPAAYSGKQVAMSEGIDEDTAAIQGAIEGLTVGVGAALPAARFVKPLAGDLAIAAGANVGLGVASRGATAELLESRGYAEQAAQYRAFDGTAMTIDAVLGAAFFGIGRGLGRAPADHQVNAALAENNSQHAALGTAPGIPVDAMAANTHVRALDIALEQLSRGEPVRLPADLPEASFLRSADDGAEGSLRQVADQEMVRLIDETDRLDPRPDPVSVEPTALRQVEQDGQLLQQDAQQVQQMGQEAQQPAANAHRPVETDPDVMSAQIALDAVGDIQVPTGAIDAEGRPVSVSARQMLADADVEIQRAQLEARGIEAAALCSLQRGE